MNYHISETIKEIRRMACFYIKHEYISEKEQNSYQYGFEILLSTIFNIAVVLCAAALLQSFLGAVLYMGSFILFRRVAGGYHAKKHWMCIHKRILGSCLR